MTFQPKARYLPDDVKAYRAPRHPMQFVWMTLAACLALVAYMEVLPNAATHGSVTSDQTPARVSDVAHALAAPMPAATPIFEPAHALGRLSSPVQCSGRSRHGLWIAHAGDRKRTGRRCI